LRSSFPRISSLFVPALRFSACVLAFIFLAALKPALAQQTNPVDRQVTDPLTDTPNINPLTPEQPFRLRRARVRSTEPLPSPDVLDVHADKETGSGPEEARVIIEEGNVDIRIGVYRLQADKVTVYEATNKLIAEGNVVFDQSGPFNQRITGTRAEFNYAKKTGFFINSTGFTNQTEDGTVIYFTADRVEKVSADKVIALNAEITACDENVPKWSFHASRVVITLNDRVRATRPVFHIKGLPVIFLPFVSISTERRDRASGFLTPTFSGSGSKGFRLSTAYYQTLGRSADVTIRNDIYAKRGLGFGADMRTRANSRSFLNFGFYVVKDRIFGPPTSPQNPNQGGSSFYADGVHYFSNGFVAAVDVDTTSSLAFRQVFSDSIQRAISPEQRSQVFVNKDSGDYSFNFLARTQVTSIPSADVRIRQLPSVTLDKRPSILFFLENLPVYFSFEGGLEGVSRKETVTDPTAFTSEGVLQPIITPSVVQRLDTHPSFSLPLEFDGWTMTATGELRATYYSNSLDPSTRAVQGRDIIRRYGQFEFDLRPPALARNYRNKDGSLRFRHVIEPYLIYRKISGINNFDRIILFDYNDAIADTNEIEFGVANRFFTRRSTENVSGRPTRAGMANGGANGSRRRAPLASQPYEKFSLTIRGKYFFDPFFGGALIPGRRNQFYPINTFSGFSYGGIPRRFSPLNFEARYRPSSHLFIDSRMNLDTEGGGLRDLAISSGINRQLFQFFQTFYYTRAITLAPSLRQFADATGHEPGTLKGSQFSPTLSFGRRDHGLFGGLSFFFDFEDRPGKRSSLVSSTLTLGYTFDCCAIVLQNYTFNVGLRDENRTVFAFRLNGIGTFGTAQVGQNFR